jgi:hypothetical protein
VDNLCITVSLRQDRGRWLNASDGGAAHMQVITVDLEMAKMVSSQKANSA